MNESSPEPAHVPFAFCVQSFFREFLQSRGSPDNVWVITTLRSGQQFVTYGLGMKLAVEVPGCLMIQGQEDSPKAIVVRESDVAGVEFQVVEEPDDESPTPFGFYPRMAP